MSLHSATPRLSPSADIFRIESTYPFPPSSSLFHLEAVQEIVNNAIPEPFLIASLGDPAKIDIGSLFYRFSKALPIIQANLVEEDFPLLPMTFIIPAEYTHGAGRYITDTLCRWLIPGQNINIIGQISLNFRFVSYPSMPFFVVQNMVFLSTPADLPIIRKNLPSLIEEIKINILAVYYARYITSLRSAPLLHKNMIMEENISSILSRKEDLDRNLYDQMQLFFTKSGVEEKIDEIKRNMSHLLTTRPKTFGREIFYEINAFSSLFRDSFSFARDPRYLSRVMAYQYLFRKKLLGLIKTSPQERHMSLKVFRTKLRENEPITALLFGFNFLRDTERFDVKHLKEVMKSCISQGEPIADSMIIDRRYDKMRFFYVELTQCALSNDEMRGLKEKLPQAIVRQIENVVHPVFMPRNDEEVMRNLIVLNNQIKYTQDPPQVSIHYDTQSEFQLTFTVILVRLLHKTSSPLSKLIQENPTSAKISIDDIRITGHLKNKYPKEAATLRISLDKDPFFRSDYSVDLLRARQNIAKELKSLLGDFRDFNGGIILKQDEALAQLRSAVGSLTKEKELLLENYFYSLRPGIMQTIYEPSILQTHFELLLKAIDFPLASLTQQMFALQEKRYFFCFIKAIAPSFKEPLMDAMAALQIPSYDLATAFLQIDQTSLMGMILRLGDKEDSSSFVHTVNDVMDKWNKDNRHFA